MSSRRRRWVTALFLIGTLCMAFALLMPGEVGIQTALGSIHSNTPRQIVLELGFLAYASAFLVMVLKRKSGSSRYTYR